MIQTTRRQQVAAATKLPQLSEELHEIRKTYVDRVIPVSGITWDNGSLIIRDQQTGFERYTVPSRVAFDQLCKLVGMPKGYAHDIPNDLLQTSFNRLLQNVSAQRLFVRMVEKGSNMVTRALLPQAFEPFDYVNLVDVLQGVTSQTGIEFNIDRGQKGPDTNLDVWNIRFIDPNSSVSLDEPEEKLFFGIDARTSETGIINPSIEPLIWQLVCTNGLKMPVAQDNMADEILRFRYYKVNTESITERMVAHVLQMLEAYSNKQEAFRRSAKARIGSDQAEKVFIDTLVGSGVVSGPEHRERLVNRLRSHRSNGDYSVYRVVSTLTEIARDVADATDSMSATPEVGLKHVDLIERKAGELLEQFAGAAA